MRKLFTIVLAVLLLLNSSLTINIVKAEESINQEEQAPLATEDNDNVDVLEQSNETQIKQNDNQEAVAPIEQVEEDINQNEDQQEQILEADQEEQPLLTTNEDKQILETGSCGGDEATYTIYDDYSMVISGSGDMVDYYFDEPITEYYESIKNLIIEEGITSIGGYAFCYFSSLTSVTIPSTITSIGEYAFVSCQSLTSISIPKSVIEIGENAFLGCSSLISITIDEDNSKYDSRNNCNAIIITETNELIQGSNSTVIPETVTSISDRAFCYCSSLTSISIPSSVTSIGEFVFGYCRSLTSITVDSNNEVYDSRDNCNAIINTENNELIQGCSTTTIPNTITAIGPYAFQGMNISSIEIPTSVISIGENAFAVCSSLTSITIPSSVTSIGGSAFGNCKSLTSVTINSSDVSIEESAFEYCPSLASVKILSSTASIGEYAFEGCSSLKSISLPVSIAFADNTFSEDCAIEELILTKANDEWDGTLSDFYNLKNTVTSIIISGDIKTISSRMLSGFESLESLTIQNGITSIGEYAFEGCSSLKLVSLPESLKYIGNEAFCDCDYIEKVTITNLESWLNIEFDGYRANPLENCEEVELYIGDKLVTDITIPSTITKISANAFVNCQSLISVTIPSTVTSIGINAFSYCPSLIAIYIPSSVSLEEIGYYDQSLFYGCQNITIYTDVSSKNDIPSNWNEYWNYVDDDQKANVIYGYSYDDYQKMLLNLDKVSEFWDTLDRTVTSITIPDYIVYIPSYAFNGCSSLTSITIPSSVISIGEYAFENCSSLKSVSLPESLEYIGNEAFSGCDYIEKVTIANLESWLNIEFDGYRANPLENCEEVELYIGDKLVTDITIPSTITEIGNNAFNGCSSLTSVTIPSSVTSIGEYEFNGCSSLKSISLPVSITFADNTFSDGCEIEELILTKGNDEWDGTLSDFYNLKNTVKSITISGDIKTISSNMFSGFGSLESLTIQNGITSIGEYAFEGCSSLKLVSLPESLKYIGNDAFCDCDYVEKVTIASLESWLSILFDGIHANPLENCEEVELYIGDKLVTDITIPSTITKISANAFINCKSLTSVTIPSSVTSIGERAFDSCNNLETVTFSDGLTSIGGSAFSSCDKLKKVNIPSIESWLKINFEWGSSNPLTRGSGLYINDQLVTNIKIPNTITKINNYAFDNYKSLESVVISNSVKTIEYRAFYTNTYLVAFIPKTVETIDKAFGQYAAIYTNSENIDSDKWNISNHDQTYIKDNSSYGEYEFWAGVDRNAEVVIVDDGIETLPSYFFKDCKNLKKIYLPESISDAGTYPFYNRDNDLVIYAGFGKDNWLGYSIKYKNENDEVEFKIYYDVNSSDFEYWDTLDKSVESLIIDDNVKSIPIGIIPELENLRYLYIDSKVSSIGENALDFVNEGVYVFVPSSVNATGTSYLNNAIVYTNRDSSYGWRLYDVDEYHYDFSADDMKYWYSIPRSELELKTSFEIKEGVTAIPKNSFAYCYNLKNVYIPSSVIKIEEGAFNDCSNSLVLHVNALEAKDTWDENWNTNGTKALEVLYEYSPIPKDISIEQKVNGDVVLDLKDATYAASLSGNEGFKVEVTVNETSTDLDNTKFIINGTKLVISRETINSLLATNSSSNVTYKLIDGEYTSDNLNLSTNKCYEIKKYNFDNTSYTTIYYLGNTLNLNVDDKDDYEFVGWYLDSSFNNEFDVNNINITKDISLYQKWQLKQYHINYHLDGGLNNANNPSKFTTESEDITLLNPTKACYVFAGWYRNASFTGNKITKIAKGTLGDIDLYAKFVEIDGAVKAGNAGDSSTFVLYDDNSLVIQGTGLIDKNILNETLQDEIETIEKIVIKDGVTGIGTRTFSGYSALKEVVIPDSVVEIKEYAFTGCTSLESVYFDSLDSLLSIDYSSYTSNPMYFAYNLYINKVLTTNINLPDDLTTLKKYSLVGSSYSTLHINDALISIGEDAFYNASIEKVYFNSYEVLLNIDFESFSSNPLSCGSKLYINNVLTTKVVVPSGITSIKAYAFAGSAIESINIANTVLSIGQSAFEYCDYLMTVKIPKSVKRIDNYAFYNCSYLTNIYYETVDSMLSIDYANVTANPLHYAYRLFINNKYTESISIPEGYTSIPFVLSDNIAIKSVTIPSSISAIDYCAFQGSNKLETVIMPDTITLIDDSAFEGCYSLKSITIPSSVLSIGMTAFYGCRSLKTVDIQSSSLSLMAAVFGGCTNLKTIFIPSTVSSIDASSSYDALFYGCSENLKIYTDALETQTNWGEYWNINDNGQIATLFDVSRSDYEQLITKDVFNITYELNGGSNDKNNITSHKYNDNEFVLKPASKSGYTFDGWYLDTEKVEKIASKLAKDITLNAVFTPITYNIEYNLIGGENSQKNPSTYNVETNKIDLEPATKTGYTFDGWYDNASYDGTPVTLISKGSKGDIELFAKFVINEYTLTFKDGDNTISTIKQDYNSLVTKPANPTKTGYTFIEWDAVIPSTMPAQNLVISAKWKANTHNVTVEKGAGIMTATGSGTYEYNSNVYVNVVPLNGYGNIVYTGNVNASSFLMPDYDVNVSVSASPIAYTITYYLNGGTNNSANPSSYTIEDNTITLLEPINNRSMFEGWYDNESYLGSPIVSIEHGSIGNKSLYAKWGEESYFITYKNILSSDINNNPTQYTYKAGGRIDLENPTRAGYDFIGWYSDDSYTNKVTSINKEANSDITLYAKWNKIPYYSISYNLNGGTQQKGIVVPNKYTYDPTSRDSIVLPIPTMKGHKFNGWYIDPEFTTPVNNVEYEDDVNQLIPLTSHEDFNLYAKWSPITYTVHFYHNNVSADPGAMESIEGVEYDEYITLDNEFDAGEYSFVKWTAIVNGKIVSYKDNAVVKNLCTEDGDEITLVANWSYPSSSVYKITYNLNGGKNNIYNPTTFNVDTPEIELQDPTKDGYTFAGWYLDKEFNNRIDTIAEGSTTNIVLYAKWELATYSLSLDYNGGDIVKGSDPDSTYDINSKITLPTLVKEGYKFVGWYKDSVDSKGTYKQVKVTTISKSFGNLNIYAVFNPISYKITYNANKGTISKTAVYDKTYSIASEEIDIVETEEITRVGYTFAGWYLDKDFIKSSDQLVNGYGANVTLYAKWEPIKYSVNFVSDEYELLESIDCDYDISYKLNNDIFEIPGKLVGKWTYKYTDSKGKEITKTIAGNSSIKNLPTENGEITLKVVNWNYNKYTIKYVLNSGKNISANKSSYTIQDNLEFASPTRTNATFLGWYLDPNFEMRVENIEDIYNINHKYSNVVLYAKWDVENYTIAYDLNAGGDQCENNQDNPYVYLDGASFLLQKPTRQGYTFVGWFDVNTDKQVKSITTTNKSNLDLYAQWKENVCTITYNLNGGQKVAGAIVKQTKVPYTELVLLDGDDFYKDGYKLIGFSTNSKSTQIEYELGESLPNLAKTSVTLYAVWEAK